MNYPLLSLPFFVSDDVAPLALACFTPCQPQSVHQADFFARLSFPCSFGFLFRAIFLMER
jgi:hypothetical protein